MYRRFPPSSAGVFLIQKKSEAHECLSLLAAREGIPNSIVMDNACRQTMGSLRKRPRDLGCHIKQVEPYSPWQNFAEGPIQEAKKVLEGKCSRQEHYRSYGITA